MSNQESVKKEKYIQGWTITNGFKKNLRWI